MRSCVLDGERGPQHESKPNLDGIIKGSRVESYERSDLVQPVRQAVAMEVERAGCGQRPAVIGKECLQRGHQVRLIVEWTQEIARQVNLRLLIGQADEGGDPERVEAMHTIWLAKA